MLKRLVGSRWLFLIMTVIFFKPEYFADVPSLDAVFDAGKVAVCLVLAFAFLFDWIKCRRVELSPGVRLSYVYILSLTFSTAVGDNRDVYHLMYYYLPVMAFLLFLDYAMRYAMNHVVGLMLPVLELLVWINLVTTIRYPEGMITFSIGFLGMKNAQITILLFTLVLSMTRDHLRGRKRGLRTVGLLAASVLTFYFNGSTTSLVAMLVLSLTLIVVDVTGSNVFNYRNMLAVVLALLMSQPLLTYLAEKYLGKGKSFGIRQVIWMRTWNQIRMKPVLGYGMTLSEYRNRIMNNEFANSAHNQLIEILYQGGIVLLFFFLCLAISQYRVLMRHHRENLAKSFSACLFALFVGMMAEVQAHHLLFFPLMVMPLYYERIVCGSAGKYARKRRRVRIRWLPKGSTAYRIKLRG